MSDCLFTYGTLQIPEVIQAVLGSVSGSMEGRVLGYSQYRFKSRIYPGMIVREGGVTQGRMYVGLGAVAWGLLDRFEDPIYERAEVEVHLADGGRVKAYAYVLPRDQEHLLSPDPWTIEWFTDRHLKEYVERCRMFYHMITLT